MEKHSFLLCPHKIEHKSDGNKKKKLIEQTNQTYFHFPFSLRRTLSSQTRIRIHKNLFVSFIINNFMW